jgi:hypothetical protein
MSKFDIQAGNSIGEQDTNSKNELNAVSKS